MLLVILQCQDSSPHMTKTYLAPNDNSSKVEQPRFKQTFGSDPFFLFCVLLCSDFLSFQSVVVILGSRKWSLHLYFRSCCEDRHSIGFLLLCGCNLSISKVSLSWLVVRVLSILLVF